MINKLSIQNEGQSIEDIKLHLQEALNKISALEEELNILKSGSAGGGGGGVSPNELETSATGIASSPDTTEVADTPAEQPQEA